MSNNYPLPTPEGSLSPLCTSQQQDLPSPSTTATLDPHREAIKGRWTDSDKDDLARIAPPLLKADRGWEEISRALPRRRSANAAKARFYQIAEERDELSTWRRQTKRGNAGGSDRGSSATPAPGTQDLLLVKEETAETQDRLPQPTYQYIGAGTSHTQPLPPPISTYREWDLDEEAALVTAWLLRGALNDWEAIRREMGEQTTRSAAEIQARWVTITSAKTKARLKTNGLRTISELNSIVLGMGHPYSQYAITSLPSHLQRGATTSSFVAPTAPKPAPQAPTSIATPTADPRLRQLPPVSQAQPIVGARPSYGQLLTAMSAPMEGSATTSTTSAGWSAQQNSTSTSSSFSSASSSYGGMSMSGVEAGTGAVPPFLNKPSPLSVSTPLGGGEGSGAGSWSAGVGAGGVPSSNGGGGGGQQGMMMTPAQASAVALLNGQQRAGTETPPQQRPSGYPLPTPTTSSAFRPSSDPRQQSSPAPPSLHYQSEPRPMPSALSLPPHQLVPSTSTAPDRSFEQMRAEQVQRQLLAHIPGAGQGLGKGGGQGFNGMSQGAMAMTLAMAIDEEPLPPLPELPSSLHISHTPPLPLPLPIPLDLKPQPQLQALGQPSPPPVPDTTPTTDDPSRPRARSTRRASQKAVSLVHAMVMDQEREEADEWEEGRRRRERVAWRGRGVGGVVVEEEGGEEGARGMVDETRGEKRARASEEVEFEELEGEGSSSARETASVDEGSEARTPAGADTASARGSKVFVVDPDLFSGELAGDEGDDDEGREPALKKVKRTESEPLVTSEVVSKPSRGRRSISEGGEEAA